MKTYSSMLKLVEAWAAGNTEDAQSRCHQMVIHDGQVYLWFGRRCSYVLYFCRIGDKMVHTRMGYPRHHEAYKRWINYIPSFYDYQGPYSKGLGQAGTLILAEVMGWERMPRDCFGVARYPTVSPEIVNGITQLTFQRTSEEIYGS